MRKGLERLKSWAVWLGIGSIVIAVSGISPENMTEWVILWENIQGIFANPFILISMVVAVFAFLNNPADSEHF